MASTVHNWKKASSKFKEKCFMYSIKECLGCDRRYEDMAGYRGSGKGSGLPFYSDYGDAGHPSYFTQFCTSSHGNYMDPFDDDWEPLNEANE